MYYQVMHHGTVLLTKFGTPQSSLSMANSLCSGKDDLRIYFAESLPQLEKVVNAVLNGEDHPEAFVLPGASIQDVARLQREFAPLQDHPDPPYRFTLPVNTQELLAWLRLGRRNVERDAA